MPKKKDRPRRASREKVVSASSLLSVGGVTHSYYHGQRLNNRWWDTSSCALEVFYSEKHKEDFLKEKQDIASTT